MAIDPRISLAVQPLDTGRTFQNLLSSIGNVQQMERQAQLAPIQQQVAELGLAQRQREEAQQAQLGRLQSVALGAAEILPDLQSDNPQAALAKLQARRQRLVEQGVPTMDTDQAIQMLSTPEGQLQLTRDAEQAIQLGQQLGVFGAGAGPTAKQRELEQFKRLPEDTEEQKRFKTQFGQAIGAISKTPSIDEKIRLAKETGDLKTEDELEREKRKEVELQLKRQQIEQQKLKIDETKIKNKEDRRAAIDAKNIRRAEADNAASIVGTLLTGDSFSSAFGRFNNLPPEGGRTQANIDARAQVDQVLGLLSLESRQKLKGQGTITDSEAKTLEKSATALANPLISDDLARRELRRVKRIFEDASDRNQLRRVQSDSLNLESLTQEDLSKLSIEQLNQLLQGQ